MTLKIVQVTKVAVSATNIVNLLYCSYKLLNIEHIHRWPSFLFYWNKKEKRS